MATTPTTLKWMAALIWLTGAAILSVKGIQLLIQAERLSPQSDGIVWALVGGILVGLAKNYWLFSPACRRNIRRIEGLPSPKPWQVFRPLFFVALALMIATGATLSYLSEGYYILLLLVGALDLSIATALLTSSRLFFHVRSNRPGN